MDSIGRKSEDDHSLLEKSPAPTLLSRASCSSPLLLCHDTRTQDTSSSDKDEDDDDNEFNEPGNWVTPNRVANLVATMFALNCP